ncbi:hypothetical protein BST39_20230 [Mycobacterium paraseoulense]|uniref:Uncharacterized protein n=1 Tax=Mycobacterium paraseoulense TaxID=590652 RepID=A0A1X0I7D1_9MYCO|nr:hypothetical protein BST39_20230 [Mycobacterium paraseoulense]
MHSRRASRGTTAGKQPRSEPHFCRARITLLPPTKNAKSDHEYYKNGYHADVEMMPSHAQIAANRTVARAMFG